MAIYEQMNRIYICVYLHLLVSPNHGVWGGGVGIREVIYIRFYEIF